MRRGLAVLALMTLVMTGCGALSSTPSASENTLPPAAATATADAAPTTAATTTPTPLVIPTSPPSTATAVPTAEPAATTPTAVPPIPTAGPRPTTTPTTSPTTSPTAAPTSAPTPVPTATPWPTATPQPTATTAPVVPVVSCSISPQRSVVVQETLVFSAASTPANVPVSFVFDHGDGTLDPGATSNAYYLAAGTYPVKARWTTSTHSGVANCGTVTVVSPTCTIGLGPADGLGWWCGDIFCREGAPNPSPICPDVAPYGCYIGMDGQQRCIPDPSEWKCLVGQGPADGFVWYCNGQLCNPLAPFDGCPAYPIYGCHETVSGPTICIDPAPMPVINCTVSSTTAVVNQVLTFTAVQTGSQIPVDFVFNHGDGTLDPTNVSSAYYAAAGTYTVTMTWNHALGSGQETCGTIVVS